MWKTSLKFYLVIIGLILLTSCGPRSLEDFREEGEGIARSLIQELQTLHTREELLNSAPRLQKLFNNLVDVMIAAKEFQEKYPKAAELDSMKMNRDLNDQLRIALNRIYRIEGGRVIMEKSQEAALHRLDAFEKRLAKIKKGNN